MTSSNSTQDTAGKPQTGAMNSLRTVHLKSIKPRVNPSTRALQIEHVMELAETIGLVGLISPITVDRHGHLIAGAHRLAALRLLAQPVQSRLAELQAIYREYSLERSPKVEQKLTPRLEQLPLRIEKVPVNVRPIDSRLKTREALAIEIAENDKRKQYNKEDIKVIIQRLEDAGFSIYLGKGRPSEGSSSGRPHLMKILGVRSRATIRKLLASVENGQIDHLKAAATSNLVSKDLAAVLRAQQRLLSREDLPQNLRNHLQAVHAEVSVYAQNTPRHSNGSQTTAPKRTGIHL